MLSDRSAVYLPLPLPRRCARSDAATSFSFLVDLGLLRILEASDAAFLPVMVLPFNEAALTRSIFKLRCLRVDIPTRRRLLELADDERAEVAPSAFRVQG